VRETRVRPGPSGGPVGGWMTVVGAGEAVGRILVTPSAISVICGDFSIGNSL
jgi:hypothetical protein